MADFHVCGFEMAHWADVAELFMAPETLWGTLQLPYQSRDDIKKRLENPPPLMHRLVALPQGEARVVGMLALRQGRGRRSHVGDLGMFVHPEFHRRGAGTALMESAIDLGERWLDLSRHELTVYVDNAAAIGLYEKFGFSVEGRLRHYALRAGELVDCLMMARLR